MQVRTLTNTKRRDPAFHQSEVADVLPSYFQSDYPTLVRFLQTYYEFMLTDDTHDFDAVIHELYTIRDLEEAELGYLDRLFFEIGNNVGTSYFNDPRYIARLFANFHRVKGSLYSAEGFFRAFYNEEVEVVYPKNNIFIVGDSKIGPDSLKYIQNYSLYQIFSVLIKSSIPISRWRELYKILVHPAGFYLAGEVIVEPVANVGLNGVTIIDSDFQALTATYTGVATNVPSGFTSITAIQPDGSDSDVFKERTTVARTIEDYQDLTIAELGAMYNSIEEAASANSPTFDDDSDVGNKSIKFSNTIETMDQDIFDQDRPPVYKDSDV